MTPAASEAALRDAFAIIPDPHERLSAIVAHCSGPGLPADEQRDDLLVPGCISRVWLAGRIENGTLHLRWDADSPLVRGLAGLVCRVYEGCPAADAAAYDTEILDGLGLTRQISPTRLNGLASVVRRIRELAAA